MGSKSHRTRQAEEAAAQLPPPFGLRIAATVTEFCAPVVVHAPKWIVCRSWQRLRRRDRTEMVCLYLPTRYHGWIVCWDPHRVHF